MADFDRTECCALRQITCGNYDTKKSITETVKEAFEERYDEPVEDLNDSDALTFFAVTTPSEDMLCKLLSSMGFEEVLEFPRVQMDGLLKMWVKTFTAEEVR